MMPNSIPPSVTTLYRLRAIAGDWEEDSGQQRAAEALDETRRLIYERKETQGEEASSLMSSLFTPFYKRRQESQKTPVRGCYIHGPVGRGKTMLADMLAETMPDDDALRLHFHVFMKRAHRYMRTFREQGAEDPVAETADALCGKALLLCFDEFQIFDIADAMLLYRLFERIFSKGVVLVATSNTAPDNLYKDGLQREHILPFIKLLKKHCDIILLESMQDYRRIKEKAASDEQRYFLTTESKDKERFADVVAALIGDKARAPAREIFMGGRVVSCGEKAGRLLLTDFDVLCREALGADDFNIIAQRYDTIVFRSLPILTEDDRQPLIRMIHFIDTLYERRRAFYCLADTEAENLYQGRPAMIPPGTARLCSRLHEMASGEYVAGIS